GIGWMRAVDAFGVPAAIGQIVLGAVTLLYLYGLGNYLAKVGRRPAVVVEDLRVLPGRAGLAAMTMAGMLMAAALASHSEALARTVLVLAMAGHGLVLVLVTRGFLVGPAEARRVTPVFHLVYVGLIVAPLAAVPLGWMELSVWIFRLAAVAAVLIWLASLLQFAREDVPAPLRPLLAIHLAPAALLGTVAMLLGMPAVALGFGGLAIVLMALMVARLPWMLAAGFSPLWGAFTFPLAAFSSLMMMLAGAGYGGAFLALGGIGLAFATVFIPWVMVKVAQMWLKGQLAVKTNAAVA
ncbi:MAG: tellurium resistance protein, partial [Alphaproteobacteria bacterium]